MKKLVLYSVLILFMACESKKELAHLFNQEEIQLMKDKGWIDLNHPPIVINDTTLKIDDKHYIIAQQENIVRLKTGSLEVLHPELLPRLHTPVVFSLIQITLDTLLKQQIELNQSFYLDEATQKIKISTPQKEYELYWEDGAYHTKN